MTDSSQGLAEYGKASQSLSPDQLLDNPAAYATRGQKQVIVRVEDVLAWTDVGPLLALFGSKKDLAFLQMHDILMTMGVGANLAIIDLDKRDRGNTLARHLVRLTRDQTFPKLVAQGRTIGTRDAWFDMVEDGTLAEMLHEVGIATFFEDHYELRQIMSREP